MEGIHENNIFCSNGAADILWRLAAGLKPKTALLPVPSFGEYEKALKSVGCEIEYFHMRESEDFTLTEDFIGKLSPNVEVTILCNPNNPTGHIIQKELLDEILAICDKNGTIVVMDECFIDFLPDAESLTTKADIEKYKNLIVLKAFTKLYAMAGVRLGYSFCGNGDTLERLYGGGQPWGVSTIAQMAGVAAAGDKQYAADSLEVIRHERKRLQNTLTDIGCKVFDSQANYLFFHAPSEITNVNLKEVLIQEGILIRSCENYRGLPFGYYRISVKTPKENDILIECLKQIRKTWERKTEVNG
jgi:threonine-phosphate decarboxylase